MGTIDPDQDFASWYRKKRDPDRYCERLYQWHQSLWSRAVPGVTGFELDIVEGYVFEVLLRAVNGTQVRLASDSIIPTWSSDGWKSMRGAHLTSEIESDTDDFYRTACTIGGYILFPRSGPGQSGDTLNTLRGKNRTIADRLDLTLECIRRHYVRDDTDTPLRARLDTDSAFFALCDSFDAYVRLFLLDDLVTENRRVLSLMTGEPIGTFHTPGYATTPAEYAAYRTRSIAFVQARNDRIRALGL